LNMTFSEAEEVRPRTADSQDPREAVLEGQSIKESFDECRVEANGGGGRTLPPGEIVGTPFDQTKRWRMRK
jgi:hypothetical protein